MAKSIHIFDAALDMPDIIAETQSAAEYAMEDVKHWMNPDGTVGSDFPDGTIITCNTGVVGDHTIYFVVYQFPNGDVQCDTFADIEPVDLKKTFCAKHFEENNGEGSADMGIEGVTFEPGTCAKCGVEAIVFWIEA